MARATGKRAKTRTVKFDNQPKQATMALNESYDFVEAVKLVLRKHLKVTVNKEYDSTQQYYTLRWDDEPFSVASDC
jgi:hypothetical protein